MKLNPTPRIKGIDPRLYDLLRETALQVNSVSEGRLQAKYNATTAAPTTGTWARGDQIPNSEPSELGSASSKYVIEGWVCTVAGTPGTWVEKRFLTGN